MIITKRSAVNLDEIEAANKARTQGEWAQAHHIGKPRAIAAASSPNKSLLAMDHDGMPIFDRTADATFAVVASKVVGPLCAALRESDAEIARLTAAPVEPRFLTSTYLDGPRRRLVDVLVGGALRSGPLDVLRIYRWITNEIDEIEQDEIIAAAARLGATQRGLRWGYWTEG